MNSLRLAFFVSFAVDLACAIPNSQPVPTRVLEHEYDPYGWSPNPTDGPHMELMRRANVFDKRQASISSGQLVGYFAPDSMCGYISGSIGASLPCSSASRCAAIAPIASNVPGAVGCCPVGGSGCYFITTCYNSADIASSKCDHGCQQDIDVRLCTSSASPFCYGYTWPDISATIWGCAASTASTKDTVLFTYAGQTEKRSWSAYYYTPTGSGASSNGLLSAASSSIVGASSSTSSSSSSSAAAGGGGGGGGGSHAGAIAGGVVGGVAVIGAVILGVVFLLLRKKKHKNVATAQPGQTHVAGGPAGHSPQHMSAVPSGAAGYYGHEHKSTMSEMGSPSLNHASPAGYAQPYHKDPNAPYDHRVSQFSEAGSPVPPYGPPGHMHPIQQAPMELDATSSAQHVNAQGHPVYEAPADVPASHTSPTAATHPHT